MFSHLEKFSFGTQALVHSQFAAFNALAAKAAECGERAMALNLAAANAFAEESSAGAQQLISSQDSKSFFWGAVGQAKLHSDKAATYGTHLAGIVSSLSSLNEDFTKAAKVQAATLLDDVIKSVPAGSESGIEFLRSVISDAHADDGQLAERTSETVETVEAVETVETVEDRVSQDADQLSQSEIAFDQA